MSKLISAIWLAFLVISAPAWAVKVKTLYEIEVSVASQASDARAEAIREGFREVLIKLTGDQDIDKNKIIKAGIDRSDYYVQEFSYSSPTVSSATYGLNIKFNEPDVKRLLRKAGAQYWSARRPLILVWLATVNEKQEGDILGSEAHHDLLEKFKKQGLRFGLPIIFPVMDVTDMDKVTTSNITSFSISQLKDASKRYQPDALLVGTIQPATEGFEGRWDLIWNDKSWNYSTTGQTQEKVISEVLNNISQTLSQRTAAKRATAELSQK